MLLNFQSTNISKFNYNKNFYQQLWWNINSDLNVRSKAIDLKNKRKNEETMEQLIDKIEIELGRFPTSKEAQFIWRDNITKQVYDVLDSQSWIKLGSIDKEFKNNFLSITKGFIKKCREFDKDLSYDDIGQAMRNVWIVSILQKVFGRKMELSSAIFGYSMLYPYTDNYLDEPNISMEDKIGFNERFRERLCGKHILGLNERESKVFELIKFIELDFPRNAHKNVYEALISIFEGQEKSLFQQKKISCPYECDILGISIEKGGASVLSDGYLIDGKLTEDEERFAYGYGFFLQLCDDLQDVDIDKQCNHMTVMSQIAGKFYLDVLVNKLINMFYKILEDDKCFRCTNSVEIKELIESNCMLMIFMAVVSNEKYFTKKYVNEISVYLPFTIRYARKFQGKIKKKVLEIQKKFSQEKLEEIIECFLNE